MKLHGRQIILNLKSQFFDMVSLDDEPLQYEKNINKMITILKLLMEAKVVTFYRYIENEEKLVVLDSTSGNIELKTNMPATSFINENMKAELVSKHIYRKKLVENEGNLFDLLIAIRSKGEFHGFLCLEEGRQTFQMFPDHVLCELSDVCSSFMQQINKLHEIILEEKRYKQLFRVTEKFHSSMNKESVLEEIFRTLQEVYPTFTYYLFLSQDHKEFEGLPIKSLNYGNDENAMMYSYVTGNVTFEDSRVDKKSILYAPLKGKQGVYGVLQVISPNAVLFPKNEVEFITLLANTAGGAIENAQLYEQSKQLISDLQLINETSHRLNSNLRLSETMDYMTQQILQSFSAEEAGFILFTTNDKEAFVQPGSTPFFFTEEAEPLIVYFKKRIIEEKEAIFVGELEIPECRNISERFKSVMAAPMIQSGVLKGFALALHHDSYYFSFETFKLFLSLIHHSTLAFTNTILREELEKMVVTDHLTKLYSRNYLDEKIQSSMKEDGGGTFIIVDIDNFKSINDTYGHQVGDEVIIQVAEIDSIQHTRNRYWCPLGR